LNPPIGAMRKNLTTFGSAVCVEWRRDTRLARTIRLDHDRRVS
jgi:hypothetical protein